MIGCRVYIRETSKYYGKAYTNPKETLGVVVEPDFNGTGWIGVNWSNGESNVYKKSDLKPATKLDELLFFGEEDEI